MRRFIAGHAAGSYQSVFGFTIVELLVVISIIALLMSFLLPSLAKSREVATRMVCAARLRAFPISTLSYASDYKGAFPYTYGQVSAFSTDAQLGPASISSMSAYLSYHTGYEKTLYCPAWRYGVWQNIPGDQFWNSIILAPSINSIAQVQGQKLNGLVWGYTKLAGTVGSSMTGCNGNARYTPGTGSSDGPGYMTLQSTENASRSSIHHGDGNDNYYTSRWGGSPTNIAPIPQPPSGIVLWADSWNYNGGNSSVISHPNANGYDFNKGVYLNVSSGKHEAFTDGHASWYTRRGDIMYRTFTGQFGSDCVIESAN